jgi:hypothetical protein
MPAQFESPELVALYHAYTAGPDAIGAQLADAHLEVADEAPLIVATGRDIALYPSGGQLPEVQSFRISARGFKEIAAVSHLGPAVASIVRLRQLGGSWRQAATGLLADVEKARAANNLQLWRDFIGVGAYRGIEEQIVRMVDYACALTDRYLRRSLEEDAYLGADSLVGDYLDGGGNLPVPMNTVMVATFFLVGMETCHRVLSWFDGRQIDWSEAMVVIAGRQGRPTAGVTWKTSSVATMIVGASRQRLPLERLYLVPHAPVFPTPVENDVTEVAAMEDTFRRLWLSIRATVELGQLMFPGYPQFQVAPVVHPDLTQDAPAAIGEMPVIHSAQDMAALVSRLRMVLEDPRQLLSGAVMDYAVQQLLEHNNDPSVLAVPGLTGVDYQTDFR